MSRLDNFPDARIVVADTMDLWINEANDELKALMKKLHGLVLNDSEAQLLTGESNMIRAAEAIIAMGPKFVVIKKGEHADDLGPLARNLGRLHGSGFQSVIPRRGRRPIS